MPTKAQNAVYKKYGVRKGALYRRMKDRQLSVCGFMWRAIGDIITLQELDQALQDVQQQAEDSEIWQAYKNCGNE